MGRLTRKREGETERRDGEGCQGEWREGELGERDLL